MDQIELLSMSSKAFLEACSLFKNSANVFQDYSINSIEHLSKVRMRKEHLHKGNYTDHFYRKDQRNFETKLPIDLEIDIERQTLVQKKSLLGKVIRKADELVDQIASRLKKISHQLKMK